MRIYAVQDRFILIIAVFIYFLTSFYMTDGALAQGHPHTTGKRSGLPVEVEYACENTFVLINSNVEPVTVRYQVVNSKETGTIQLVGAPSDDPGYTEKLLRTRSGGNLELYPGTKRARTAVNDHLPCATSRSKKAPSAANSPAKGAPSAANSPAQGMSVALDPASDPAIVGSWSAPAPWPVVAIHLHLLPDGQVLSFGLTGYPQLWDPKTGEFRSVPAPINVFCSGHTFLADGRLLVVGGHISNNFGLPGTNLFDPQQGVWSPSATMPKGRWYPTATTMANGDVLITAGTDETAQNVLIPEIWSSGVLTSLPDASRALIYYPRSFLAPNGKIFFAGVEAKTTYFDPAGGGRWTTVGPRKIANRQNGGAVMYEPGKVLYAGGGRTTNTAEIIDLNRPRPVWSLTGSMEYARHHFDLTLLPTGEVLATGGVAGTAANDLKQAVFAAELWNPSTGTWRTLASSRIPRGYHETAILLPDGRILKAGSGEGGGGIPQRNFEIFSPPYLFAGPRPTITTAPPAVAYGETFHVETPDAASITKISFIRLGSTTHAFDMNQRYQTLSFTADDTGLNVTVPDNRNITPPGHYMLFLLNAAGVPSEAKIIQVN